MTMSKTKQENQPYVVGPIEQQHLALCKTVLDEVDRFFEGHKMGEIYFGKKAAGVPSAMKSLRAGKHVQPRTLDKIRAFIKSERAETAEDSNASGLVGTPSMEDPNRR